MASVTVASNNNFGKWVPYYNKAFNLGKVADGTGSTDGEIYITQTNGSSQLDHDIGMTGSCDSELNCDFYYEIIIETDGGNDYFYVKKYSLTGREIDTIYATETGGSDDGRFWEFGNTHAVSIDEGVQVFFEDNLNYDNGDIYKVTLPSRETMVRRRIYHGGYSTFTRMPYTEGIAYHTDIIPTNLKGRNMTVIFNPPVESNMAGVTNYGLGLEMSHEDNGGNKAVSLALEWNLDRSGANSITAPTTSTYDFPANETWQLGTMFMDDIQPSSNTDTPAIGHMPSSDVDPENATTGSAQRLNVSVAGRAGIAKMSIHYASGTGGPAITAHNQYWKIILMLS